MRIQEASLNHTMRIMSEVEDKPSRTYLDGVAYAAYNSAVAHYEAEERSDRRHTRTVRLVALMAFTAGVMVMTKRKVKKEVKEEA